MVTAGIELPTEDGRCRIAASLTSDLVLGACREQLREADPAARGAWRVCRPVEALYHPERYLRLAFVLLADEALAPERYWPEGDVVYLHWPVRRPLSRRGTVLRIGGVEVEVYRFPNDRRLRSLRRFTSKTSAAALWRSWAERSPDPVSADPESLRRVLIRYVPEQKFVARIQARAYQRRSDDVDRGNIAVRSASPTICATLARRHNTAACRARAGSKYLYVPQAAVADAAGGLVAFEWVRGRSLLEKLQTGEFARVMRRMAHTLSSFHRLPADQLATLRSADVSRRAEDAVADLGITCPELRPRLAALASELRRRLAEIPNCAPVTLHDDLHWNQVRIRQRRYALLDLERMCVGDPLIDVANFATQVRMLGQRPELGVEPASATRWAGEFIEQWASAAGQAAAPGRFHPYAAVALLELARGMMRHLRPGWRALARCCTAEAEAELSRAAGGVAVP